MLLTIIIADCDFTQNLFSHTHPISQNECNDFSNHIEHSHQNHFGEEVFISISKDNFIKNICEKHLSFSTVNHFKNSDFSTIWQPPKLS